MVDESESSTLRKTWYPDEYDVLSPEEAARLIEEHDAMHRAEVWRFQQNGSAQG
jgi:hypothetical protein